MNIRNHPLYSTWYNMIYRCDNPIAPSYKYYGERGITVCERWYIFSDFVEDMGPRPDGYTLDRINNDGNYEPSNCCWSTPTTQIANRRPRSAPKKPRPYVNHSSLRVANNPMRNIHERNGNYIVTVSIMGKPIRKSFTSLDDALDFRSDLEMEREMHRLLS